MKGKIYYGIILFITLSLYIWFGAMELFVVLAVLVLLGFLSVLLNKIVSKMLKINIDIFPVKGETNQIEYKITVKNKSFIPAFNLKLEGNVNNLLMNTSEKISHAISITPFGKKEFIQRVHSDYCGRISIAVTDLKCHDLLGLSAFDLKYEKKGDCYIYPEEKNIGVSELCRELQKLSVAEHYQHRKGNDITEILDIREYQRGDNVKNIHWKLSKKHGKKLVRELDLPANQDIILFFVLGENLIDNPIDRNRLVGTVVSAIEDLLFQQMRLDAVLFDEKGNTLGSYSLEGNDSREWYEHILLDGDISFSEAVVYDYIKRHHIVSRYSVIVLVSDEETQIEKMATNIVRIEPV